MFQNDPYLRNKQKCNQKDDKITAAEFFGDSFSKKQEDDTNPPEHACELTQRDKAYEFVNKIVKGERMWAEDGEDYPEMVFDDDEDVDCLEDREALKMYQISFTGPQAIETVNCKQSEAPTSKFISDDYFS